MLIIFNPSTAEHKETQIPSQTNFNGLRVWRICSIFSHNDFCEDATYVYVNPLATAKLTGLPEMAQLLVQS
jgi:hypothetical protein